MTLHPLPYVIRFQDNAPYSTKYILRESSRSVYQKKPPVDICFKIRVVDICLHAVFNSLSNYFYLDIPTIY